MSKAGAGFAARMTRLGKCYVWHDSAIEPGLLRKWLIERDLPPQAATIDGSGRGSAWRVQWQNTEFLFRIYRRGGAVAKFNRDRYVWLGASHSRSAHEFRVLARLYQARLPVPRPAGSIACRSGGFLYRAALLTHWIDNIGSLASIDEEAAWFSAGQSIAMMHGHGVWHADLNVHNILLDGNRQAWLIDFDRAKIGVHRQSVLAQNLERLLRSVRKVCPNLEHSRWPALLRGYRSL